MNRFYIFYAGKLLQFHLFKSESAGDDGGDGQTDNDAEISEQAVLGNSQNYVAQGIDAVGDGIDESERRDPCRQAINRKKRAGKEEKRKKQETGNQLKTFKAFHLRADNQADTDQRRGHKGNGD